MSWYLEKLKLLKPIKTMRDTLKVDFEAPLIRFYKSGQAPNKQTQANNTSRYPGMENHQKKENTNTF